MRFRGWITAILLFSVVANAQQTDKKPLDLTPPPLSLNETESELCRYCPSSSNLPSQSEKNLEDIDHLNITIQKSKEMNIGLGIKNLHKGQYVFNEEKKCAFNWKLDPTGKSRAGIVCGSTKKAPQTDLVPYQDELRLEEQLRKQKKK